LVREVIEAAEAIANSSVDRSGLRRNELLSAWVVHVVHGIAAEGTSNPASADLADLESARGPCPSSRSAVSASTRCAIVASDTEWCLGDGRTWDEIAQAAHGAAIQWGAAHGFDAATSADFAQEALLRLHRRVVQHPRAWFRRVFVSIASRAARGRADLPLGSTSEPTDECDLDLLESSERDGPLAILICRDALSLIDRLPPPYREIARLQYAYGWGWREVAAWLQVWRPSVGPDACRRAIRTTHVLLRAVGRGIDPAVAWPGRFFPRKNRWIGTPPPPFLALCK
jgi:DNA-directed RNA polymerase specialized sigma24 family protein